MQLGKLIGKGNTATVYEWGEGTVLKLFVQDYPKYEVEREFQNVTAINDMSFAKPKAYEMINCEEQLGIIYGRVEGESLLNWVLEREIFKVVRNVWQRYIKQLFRTKLVMCRITNSF